MIQKRQPDKAAHVGRANTKRKQRTEPVAPSSWEDEETGWQQSSHFQAGLSNVLSRARRHGREVTLIYFRLPLSAWTPDSRLRLYLTLRLQLLQREVKPGVASFGRLAEDEFAVCVANTDEFSAHANVMLLRQTLDDLAPEVSTAIFPRDGEDRDALLSSVTRALEEHPSNIIDFEAYRRRRGPRAA